MTLFAERVGISQPTDLLPTGVPKWTAKVVKKLSTTYLILKKLLAGELSDKHPIVKEAIEKIAVDKADIYNSKFLKQIEKPNVEFPKFNPSSSNQKRRFFEWLGIESESISKDTGLPSWGRTQIERVNRETTDENVRDFTQQLIDFSFAGIIKNNFIKAFYKYTVDDRLYGSYVLFGAKSGRFTSKNPNMLNAPSTGSIFAKPVKACFVAPKGKVIIDKDKVREVLNEYM